MEVPVYSFAKWLGKTLRKLDLDAEVSLSTYNNVYSSIFYSQKIYFVVRLHLPLLPHYK